MSIHIDARLRAGAFRLKVESKIDDSTVCLVGANGSGKSTLLRGFVGAPVFDSAFLAVGSAVLEDSANGVSMPSGEREIGYLPQSAPVFPHMTVKENLAFARAGLNPSLGEELVREFDLSDLLERSAGSLSGGQAQLVGLVRAMASSPALLLLDEPFSAIDLVARKRVRQTFKTHLARSPARLLLATHDPRDVAELGGALMHFTGSAVETYASAAQARQADSAYLREFFG